MSRKPLNEKGAMTAAERQRKHRRKVKEELVDLRAYKRVRDAEPSAAVQAAEMAARMTPATNELREQVKKELREAWEPELKAARINEQRKEGRRLARQADHNFENGRFLGIIQTAAHFARINPDITRAILAFFVIDREKAAAILAGDKRTKSPTLALLDTARAWQPPKGIK